MAVGECGGIPLATQVHARRWERFPKPLAGSFYSDATRLNDAFVSSFNAERRLLPAHTGCVNAISYSEDYRLLATGSDDTRVGLYDTTEWQRVSILDTPHQANIFGCTFLPNTSNSLMITCALDGALCELNLEKEVGRVLWRAPGYTSGAKFCPTTSNCAGLCLVQTQGGDVYGFDRRMQRPPLSLLSFGKSGVEINALAMTPTDPYVVAAGGRVLVVQDLRYLYSTVSRSEVTDASSLQPLVSLTLPNTDAETRVTSSGLFRGSKFAPATPQRRQVCNMRFSDSGSQLVVNLSGDDVFTYDWLALRTSRPEPASSTSDGPAGSWERFSDIRRFSGRRNNRTMFKEAAFFLDDRYVVSGGDCGNLYFWNADNGQLVHRVAGDTDIVNGVLCAPVFRHIICCGIDNDAKVLTSSGDFTKTAENALDFGRARAFPFGLEADDHLDEESSESEASASSSSVEMGDLLALRLLSLRVERHSSALPYLIGILLLREHHEHLSTPALQLLNRSFQRADLEDAELTAFFRGGSMPEPAFSEHFCPMADVAMLAAYLRREEGEGEGEGSASAHSTSDSNDADEAEVEGEDGVGSDAEADALYSLSPHEGDDSHDADDAEDSDGDDSGGLEWTEVGRLPRLLATYEETAAHYSRGELFTACIDTLPQRLDLGLANDISPVLLSELEREFPGLALRRGSVPSQHRAAAEKWLAVTQLFLTLSVGAHDRIPTFEGETVGAENVEWRLKVAVAGLRQQVLGLEKCLGLEEEDTLEAEFAHSDPILARTLMNAPDPFAESLRPLAQRARLEAMLARAGTYADVVESAKAELTQLIKRCDSVLASSRSIMSDQLVERATDLLALAKRLL